MTIQQAFDSAVANHRAGRLGEAEGIYQQILAQDPRQPDALRLLGVLLFQATRFEKCASVLERAVAAGQGSAEIYYYLGTSLWKCRRLAEAVGALQKSLEIQPKSFAANNSLGLALISEGKLDEGIKALRCAVDLNPKASEPLVNVGNALRSVAQIDEALACFNRAVDLNDDPAAWDNVLFTLNYLPGLDPDAIRKEHERWYSRIVAPRIPVLTPHPNDRAVSRRLRVGFVSGDFNRHPVARFLLPLLENLDRSLIEIFCYSNTTEIDAQTERFRAAAHAWRDIRGIGDVQAAGQVRNDQIDILIDLSLHGEANRLGLFALKPAPAQATWLGYAGTTGLHTVDYRITDPVIDPPDAGDAFVEKAARLGGCFWCYRHPDFAPDVSELPSRRNGYITFGCLNNFAKVNDQVVRVWGQLMASVPNSRIAIHSPAGSHRERVVRNLANAGIEANRVRFVGFLPTDQYLAEYAQIDIALDPFPFGGGTTTFDALWMGVPTVTLAGRIPAGRGGASILTNLGKPNWIAKDEETYMEIARELAADFTALAQLRSELRSQVASSPLVDAKQCARDMETILRRMWQIYCST
jgi:predicted O-linked N-acetylglucosamine transferase (SPINDLY family)